MRLINVILFTSEFRLNLSQVWQSAVLLPGIPHPGILPVGKLNPKYARSTLNYPWLHCGTSESSKVGDVGPICPIIPGANIPLSKASPSTSFAHKFESLSEDQKARLNILRCPWPTRMLTPVRQWSMTTIDHCCNSVIIYIYIVVLLYIYIPLLTIVIIYI